MGVCVSLPRDYDKWRACLSPAALPGWRGGLETETSDAGWGRECFQFTRVTCCHRFQADTDPGCHTSVSPAWSRRADALPATLHGCLGSSSAHYCTQTHSPAMIYCFTAYGIRLEPSGPPAVRCGGGFSWPAPLDSCSYSGGERLWLVSV